jgi:hypothetical protein
METVDLCQARGPRQGWVQAGPLNCDAAIEAWNV